MSWQQIRTPTAAQRRLLDELLQRVHPDRLEEVAAKVRHMRESFTCPDSVRDRDHFKDVVLNFYSHYVNAFYGVPFYNKDKHHDKEARQRLALEFLERHLKPYPGDIYEAEENAVKGWNGGIISVIDAFTSGLITLHIDTYATPPYLDVPLSGDLATNYWIVEQILERYGQLLFREDRLFPGFWVCDMTRFLKVFAIRWHALRTEFRC